MELRSIDLPPMDSTLRLFQCECETQMLLVEPGKVKEYPALLMIARKWDLPLMEGGDLCPNCDRPLEGQCEREFLERRDGKWTGERLSAQAQAIADVLNEVGTRGK